jgi:hypothetical protein
MKSGAAIRKMIESGTGTTLNGMKSLLFQGGWMRRRLSVRKDKFSLILVWDLVEGLKSKSIIPFFSRLLS